MDDGGVDSRIKWIQSETTVKENMGRTFLCLATEGMVKFSCDAFQRPCEGRSSRFEKG